jgi:hypothetical protein
MAEYVQVKIEFLEAISKILLGHLRNQQGDSIALEKDLFWSIPGEQIYDVYSEPTELTIGQLTDALANLNEVAVNPDSATSYALVWLADILRAVGQSIVE